MWFQSGLLLLIMSDPMDKHDTPIYLSIINPSLKGS